MDKKEKTPIIICFIIGAVITAFILNDFLIQLLYFSIATAVIGGLVFSVYIIGDLIKSHFEDNKKAKLNK